MTVMNMFIAEPMTTGLSLFNVHVGLRADYIFKSKLILRQFDTRFYVYISSAHEITAMLSTA